MCEGGRPGLSMAEEEAAGGGGERRPRGWRAVAFIVGFFAAAFMATNSFSTPLQVYLIDRYNMKENAATNVYNIYTGLTNFAPVVGAFVADAFWGRFRTMLFGSVFGIIGMVVITLSATIRQLKPPSCSAVARQAGTCVAPSALQRAVLYAGMGLLAVSLGATNPTALPFGADQFDETNNERHKAGLTRYFNWFYAVTMMAMFLGLTLVVYVQFKVGWGLGFAIPTVLMLVAFAVFLVGTSVYVYVPPEGSIFSSVARVVVASCRKWRLRLPHPDDARRQEELLYSPAGPVSENGGTRVFRLPLTLQLSFLNKAAIVTDADEIRPDGSPAMPWNLCSVQQVEEVKCIVKIVPVWVSGVVWFVVMTEMLNYTTIQALTMNLHIGSHFTIPPVSILAVFYLFVALFVPVYDLLIVRAARYLTAGGITLLQRQGTGLAVGVLGFVVAAVVEPRRRSSALGHGDDGMSPLSVFLLAPQLALMGVSGALSMIGQLEFYNTEFPDQMRTLANAAFYCAQGASSYQNFQVLSFCRAKTSKVSGRLEQVKFAQ